MGFETFLASDGHAHMCFLDHGDVIGAIANRESYVLSEIALGGSDDLGFLLGGGAAAQHSLGMHCDLEEAFLHVEVLEHVAEHAVVNYDRIGPLPVDAA